jgi:hypothetical protein
MQSSIGNAGTLSAGGTYLNLPRMNRNDVGTHRVPAGTPADDLAIVRMADGFVLGQPILRADVAGMPLEWVDYKEAARLHAQGQVAYTVGTPLYQLRGGFNAATGRRSVLELNSIIATIGTTANPGNTRHDYVPPLNNQTLFRRDGYLCLYCAQRFTSSDLSRDHIRPFSQGGRDTWNNVATACRRCNNAKASRTPEQAKMQLIAVPFTPTYAEYIFLKGRRVLADQMQYLLAHFPRSSPLHARIRDWMH